MLLGKLDWNDGWVICLFVCFGFMMVGLMQLLNWFIFVGIVCRWLNGFWVNDLIGSGVVVGEDVGFMFG